VAKEEPKKPQAKGPKESKPEKMKKPEKVEKKKA
jgi:hypothetical protein